jgi:hypothetical protein
MKKQKKEFTCFDDRNLPNVNISYERPKEIEDKITPLLAEAANKLRLTSPHLFSK